MAIRVSTPADDVVALTDVAPIPGLGFLPVNAYLVRAEQPLLVDSSLPTSRPDFVRALWSQIEPADLRWIYLTYDSPATTGFYDLRTGTCFTSDCFDSPVASEDHLCSHRLGHVDQALGRRGSVTD